MRSGLIAVMALCGAVSSAPSPVWARGEGVPNLDYASTCRATPLVASDREQQLKSCLNDEKRAKDELPQQWARSKAEWRESCLRQTTLGGLASYVELITCLEMHDPNPPSLNRPGVPGKPGDAGKPGAAGVNGAAGINAGPQGLGVGAPGGGGAASLSGVGAPKDAPRDAPKDASSAATSSGQGAMSGDITAGTAGRKAQPR